MRLFDLHCDTLYRAVTEKKTLNEGDFHISLNRGAKYESWLQCFAIWIPDDIRGKDALSLFDNAVSKFKSEIQNNTDIIKPCGTKNDIKSVCEENGHGAILTVEGGAALAGDINKLDYMAECGVKIITLTWNGTCELGDGIEVNNPIGITKFGKEAVTRMEKLGIAVDVSHASEKLFYDVCEISTKPFIATHSNARRVCSHKRNLTDDQFKIIRNIGGVVGINFCDYFLRDNGGANFSDILKNVEYFLSLGGEKTVCMGTDFDGTDMPKGIKGIESINDLYEYFLRHNYPESLLDDIFFNNAYRFFTEIL